MNKPLVGLRVLTIESFGAAPYGSMLLGDLGAEVIKIEDPSSGGDASRGVGPHYFTKAGDSQYFQSFNRSKKSLAVDLKKAEGQAVLKALVADSDAIFNNLRGDLPAKLGLDYAALRSVNPRIVCVHLSAYGRDNERAAWPGYDYLMQAETGAMSVTGEPDGPPSRMGLSVVDLMTGLTAVAGLLSAIIAAKRTGEGCDVDTSLFDVALNQLAYLATWYLNEGSEADRLPRSAHPTIAPTQLFKTLNGWIMVMCMKDKFWLELIRVLDRSDLSENPAFKTVADRRVNMSALSDALDAEFQKRTTDAWMKELAGVVPSAPVYGIAQALDSAFVSETGMIASVPHADRPDFRMLASPLKINAERPMGAPCGRLGEDTVPILSNFGFDAGKIRSLMAMGVVGEAMDEA